MNLDRDSEAWTRSEEMTGLAEAYGQELRKQGLIDFEDIVHYGQRLVNEYDWVLSPSNLARRDYDRSRIPRLCVHKRDWLSEATVRSKPRSMAV